MGRLINSLEGFEGILEIRNSHKKRSISKCNNWKIDYQIHPKITIN